MLVNIPAVLKKGIYESESLLHQSCNRYLPFSFKRGTPHLSNTHFQCWASQSV